MNKYYTITLLCAIWVLCASNPLYAQEQLNHADSAKENVQQTMQMARPSAPTVEQPTNVDLEKRRNAILDKLQYVQENHAADTKSIEQLKLMLEEVEDKISCDKP